MESTASEAKDAWLHGEPALRQVQTALKEVLGSVEELRDFTMDQWPGFSITYALEVK